MELIYGLLFLDLNPEMTSNCVINIIIRLRIPKNCQSVLSGVQDGSMGIGYGEKDVDH